MIDTTNRIVLYVGTATPLTAFLYPFKVFAQGHLVVTQIDGTTGVESTLALGADYTVSGVLLAAGGAITLTVALPDGDTLKIERTLPLLQDMNVRSQTTLDRGALEDAYDKLVMQIQQVSAAVTEGGTGVQEFTTATRPAASAAWENKTIKVKDVGLPVKIQMCIERAAEGTYSWETYVLGRPT